MYAKVRVTRPQPRTCRMLQEPAAAPAPRERGPKTPEGMARSSMNALKHSLRARTFGLLPGEDQAEWGQHLHDLRAGLGPADAAEEKLVAALAAAMTTR